MTKARDLGDNAQNTKPKVVDAKGDLIVGTGADAADRLAVSDNGSTLVADSAATVGLRYQANFAAGKNKVINGDFGIWQRGTSFSNPANGAFFADRFSISFNGTGATRTISQQTFTPGTAPVAGYEGQYFLRFNDSVAGSGETFKTLRTTIEDVRTFAGQTVTFSYWAKASGSVSLSAGFIRQNFGSGGSANNDESFSAGASLTTDWQRFSHTITLDSVSGKTIGSGSFIQISLPMPLNATFTIDTWGWQLEAGSVATAFQTATGTIQGELAACQRYYYLVSNGANKPLGVSLTTSTTLNYAVIYHPVEMRTTPTLVQSSGTNYYTLTGINYNAFTAIDATTGKITEIYVSTSGLTANQAGLARCLNALASIALSAEL